MEVSEVKALHRKAAMPVYFHPAKNKSVKTEKLKEELMTRKQKSHFISIISGLMLSD